jgi:hypothetical protein
MEEATATAAAADAADAEAAAHHVDKQQGGKASPLNGAISPVASSSPTAPAAAAAPDAQLQATLAKYKRLLSLARRSIEENQRQIADKDAVISVLQDDLEAAEEARRSHEGQEPVRVAHRRVQCSGKSWVLFELDDEEERLVWRGFDSEADMNEFVRTKAATGEPVVVPEPSLTPHECADVQAEANAKVAKIREDYRRYRVKAELGQKQLEAQLLAAKRRSSWAAAQAAKDAVDRNDDEPAPPTAGESGSRKVQQLTEEVNKLQQELSRQDDMWRAAHDKAVREAEQLKRQGSETALAAQWRQRYEGVVRERDDLRATLEMAAQGGGRGGNAQAHNALAQKYASLQEEYALYRKKAMAALKTAGGDGPTADGVSSGEQGSTLPYVKNLVKNYLCADEPTAKERMERALMTVLKFSPEESGEVEKKKRVSIQSAWLPNVSFLSGT